MNLLKKNKTNNKYSFLTIKKSQLDNSSLDDLSNVDSKDNGQSLEINTNIYSLGEFVLESSLDKKYTCLYRDIGNNELAVLYEKSYLENGSIDSYIYTSDGAYWFEQQDGHFPRYLTYVPENVFNFFNDFDKFPSFLCTPISDHFCTYIIAERRSY